MRRGWVLIALGCRQKYDPHDTSGCCEGCCVDASVTYPDYVYTSFNDNLADYEANFTRVDLPRVETLNIDVASFVGNIVVYNGATATGNYAPLTSAEIETVLRNGLLSWDGAGAAMRFEIGDTAKNCCNSLTDSSCIDCDSDDESDVYFWAGASVAAFPDAPPSSTLASAAIDADGECLLSKDLVFFSGYDEDSGAFCTYTWVYPFDDSDMEDCTDGIRSKNFHAVSVHEFGHLFGLDHQDGTANSTASIMNAYSGCFTCSLVAVQDPDETALVELYDQCP